MSQSPKKILVAVLDWGLGHATRSLVLIQALRQRGCTVAVASSGNALLLLRKELPEAQAFELPAYNPVYPQNSAMVFKMGSQLPHFIRVINNEQKEIERLAAAHSFDLIISDNRYGAYSNTVKSIFITHQVQVLMPSAFKWMQPAVNYFNRRQISRFTACWVPAPETNPFPELMPPTESYVCYIGYLSRLEVMQLPVKYDLMVICSGPEPQRTIFEKLVLKELPKLKGRVLLVRGRPDLQAGDHIDGDVQMVNYLNGHEMSTALAQSRLVLTRPGYSSIMDLGKLGKKAIFVPTPGQTEQEYIGDVLMKEKTALCVQQNSFNLLQAMEQARKYKGFAPQPNDNALQNAIDAWL